MAGGLGFEPRNADVKDQCVKPLHQPPIKSSAARTGLLGMCGFIRFLKRPSFTTVNQL